MKHTPAPWKITKCINSPAPSSIDICHEDKDGFAFVCDCGDFDNAAARANADFIVRASNSHAELLDALKAIVDAHDNFKTVAKALLCEELYNRAVAAIQKAEGK